MKMGRKLVGHPVDVATGTLYATYEDISIPGKVALTWERRYTTALLDLNISPTPLGPGWTTRYFATLTQKDKEFHFFAPEGYIEIFADPEVKIEKGEIIRNLGTFQELIKQGNRYIITRWDVETGDIERFVFNGGKKDDAWPLASIEDVTGQGLDLLHDVSGRVTGIRQRLEKRTLLIDYTSNNRISSVSFLMPDNSRQTLARYEYDTYGRLITAYNALGYADRYEYDVNSRMIREYVKNGGEFYFKYDAKGRCIKTSGLDRYDEKTFRYLDSIRWTEVTNSLCHVIRYQWLPSGQVVTEINPIGAKWQTEYDGYGRIIAEINPIGATTKYEYDKHGNRCKIINALGNEYMLTFSNTHLTDSLTEPNGAVWKHQYDLTNRLVAIEDPLGGCWTVTYEANTVIVRAPNAVQKRQVFSENGILVEATDWDDNSSYFSFDDFGRLVKIIGPLGDILRVQYDLLGKPLRFTFPDGSQITCTYDAIGNLTSLTNGSGFTTKRRYGPCSRILEETNSQGAVIRYVWGLEPKHLEKIINEKGEFYTFIYNEAGCVILEKDFSGREQSFSYDLARRCVARINGKNEKILFERDSLGRVVKQILPDGISATFKYDHLGYLVSAINPDCEVLFERDPLHRIIQEVQGNYSIESRFDAAGNLIQTTTSLEHRADYMVNSNGLLTRLSTNKQSLELKRNARGQEISRYLPGGMRLEQRYDSVGQLVEQHIGSGRLMSHKLSLLPTASMIIQRQYSYDGRGALTSIKDSHGGQINYIYDIAERLLDAVRKPGGDEHFSYDNSGNIKRVITEAGDDILEYGPGDRLLQKGQTRYIYDDNGRLIKKIERLDEQNHSEWHYAWDALDQLRSVRTPKNEVWQYGYDALGRRVFKQGPGRQIRFVWDQNVIVHELENDRLKSTWIFDHYNFKPLCKLQDGELYSAITDHLGTPCELVDMNGSIVWSASYSSWGEVNQKMSDKIDCQIRFQGQWYDSETGLHYNRFRYYDPQVGRFICTEPIQLAGGLNTYAYTRNPINWVDPFGREGRCNGDDDPQNQLVTYYHYSSDPPESFANGLWRSSAATTLPGLNASTASQGLGIPPPLYCYPVTVNPSVTPVTPPRPVAASNRYTGGLPEVFFPRGTPQGSVGQPIKVPQT